MEQHRKEEEFVVEILDKSDKIVEQKPQSTAYRTLLVLVILIRARTVFQLGSSEKSSRQRPFATIEHSILF